MMKVVLCGPPHSGKSCLREGLKQAILRRTDAPYPYVITACPDGEGAWFSRAAENDPNLARTLKDTYKSKFTPEFVAQASRWVRQCKLPLVIVDVGGKISEENRQIMAGATHAVILAGDMSAVPAWREFCAEIGLQVIAVIHSDYRGSEDIVIGGDPLTGSIHYLERGVDVSERPMIKALVDKILMEVT